MKLASTINRISASIRYVRRCWNPASAGLFFALLGATAVCVEATAQETVWYGSVRGALLSDDEDDLTVRDQGSRVGLRGVYRAPSLQISLPFRFELGVVTSAGLHDDREDEDAVELRLGRIGVKGGFGELHIGRQWSPYYHFLNGFTDVFTLNDALPLFAGEVCLPAVGRAGGCSNPELEDVPDSDARYDRLDFALSYAPPLSDKVDAQYRSWHGWEGQLALTEDLVSYAAGFFTPGARFGDPLQHFGIAFAGINNHRDGSYAYGASFGGRTANGFDFGMTVEKFQVGDDFEGESGKITLVMHDLSKRIGRGDTARLWPTANYFLVNSSLKFGLNYRQGSADQLETKTRDYYFGWGYRHSPYLSFALEYAYRDGEAAESRVIGFYARYNWQKTRSLFTVR